MSFTLDFLCALLNIHIALGARNNVNLHREDGQLPESESSTWINETRVWCRDYRIWLWRWSSGKSNGSSREERRGARTWLGKKMYGLRGFNQNIITNIPIAGSFPHTFSQCLQNTSILGSTARSSFISKWLSSRDPTRLFQVFLGNGQHSFAAHGRWNSWPRDHEYQNPTASFFNLNHRTWRIFIDQCRSFPKSGWKNTSDDSMAVGDQEQSIYTRWMWVIPEYGEYPTTYN